MAQGEMVALTGRTYLNADRSTVVPADAPDAAWFLGGEGYQIPRDQAEAYGLKEGEGFGPVPNAMAAILEQERRNRAAMAETGATVIQPPPVSTATTPERNAFHRESGEMIGSSNAQAQSSASQETSSASEGQATEATPEEAAAATSRSGSATRAK